MQPQSAERASVPDQIFMRLCEAILSGRYVPGDALPTQRRLALEFDANLASVREATARLEQLGLIDVRQGSAMRVLDWHRHGGIDLIAHVLVRAGGFDRATLQNVLEARRLLLTESARLAATRRSDEQARRLAELAELIESSELDDDAQQLDFAFYEELIDASGNLVFTLVMNSVRDLYLASAALYRGVVADREQLTARYRAIADAVREADASAAAAATRELAALQEQWLLEALA